MASIPVSSCNVFVQLWVDTNAVQEGSTRGVYVVDNRVASGSENEGTPGLVTFVTQGTNVCWQVFTVSPCVDATVQIQSIGNSNAWGPSGQPQMVPGQPNTFTGQVQKPGGAGYQVNLTVQLGTGSGFTVPLSDLGLNVLAA